MVSAHERWNLFFNRRVEPPLKLSGVQVLVSATASQQRNNKRRLSETGQRSLQTIALWSGIGFSALGARDRHTAPSYLWALPRNHPQFAVGIFDLNLGMDQGGDHAAMLCPGRKAPQIGSGDSKNRPRW